MIESPKSPAESIRRRQGQKIREIRQFRNLTQSDIARSVGVTKAAVSEWERGASSPRPHLQRELCVQLGIPWSTIFNLDEVA